MKWDEIQVISFLKVLTGNQISVSDPFTSQILRRHQSATGESIGAVYKVTWPCICCDLLAYTATESSFTYAQQAQSVYFSVARTLQVNVSNSNLHQGTNTLSNTRNRNSHSELDGNIRTFVFLKTNFHFSCQPHVEPESPCHKVPLAKNIVNIPNRQ